MDDYFDDVNCEGLTLVMLKMLDCWGVTLSRWICSSDVLKNCCGFIVKAKALLFSGLCDLKMMAPLFFETLGTMYTAVKYHTPQKLVFT